MATISHGALMRLSVFKSQHFNRRPFLKIQLLNIQNNCYD